MTYDALEKVGKKELIQWMRKNVFLPKISDEEFLRQVKLEKLFEEQQLLLEQDKELCEKLQASTDNYIKFMALMVESDKLQKKIDAIDKEIDRIMKQRRADNG